MRLHEHAFGPNPVIGETDLKVKKRDRLRGGENNLYWGMLLAAYSRAGRGLLARLYSSACWIRAVDVPSSKPQLFNYMPKREPAEYELFAQPDSERIEAAFQANKSEVVVEADGLMTVDLEAGLCRPTYWDGPAFAVHRSLWFEKVGNKKVAPVSAKVERELEAQLASGASHVTVDVPIASSKRDSAEGKPSARNDAFSASKNAQRAWNKDPASSETVTMTGKFEKSSHGIDVTLQPRNGWLPSFSKKQLHRGFPGKSADRETGDSTAKTNAAAMARLIKGATPYASSAASPSPAVKERPEFQPRKIQHLVFCVHGIGQLLSVKFEQVNFVKDVDEFRAALDRAYRKQEPTGTNSGIQVLPVMWRHKLDDVVNGLRPQQLFPSSNIAADAVLDFVMYTESDYRQRILRLAAVEMNRMFKRFCGLHPEFAANPKVSLVGHSLGSVITYDLMQKSDSTRGGSVELAFDVENVFGLGSPLGVLELIHHNRPIDTGRARALYNIMRLTDPVSARLEPLVTKKALDFGPQPLDGGSTNLLQQFKDIASEWTTHRDALASKATAIWHTLTMLGNNTEAGESDSENRNLVQTTDISAVYESGGTLAELQKFNRYGRLDFALTETLDIGVILGIAGHLMYLDNEDVAAFVLKELLRAPSK